MGAYDLFQKIWRKMKLLPDATSHGLEVHTENHAKKMASFRRFWAEEPPSRKKKADKCYLYRSMRQKCYGRG